MRCSAAAIRGSATLGTLALISFGALRFLQPDGSFDQLQPLPNDGGDSHIHVMEEHQLAGRAWYDAAIEHTVTEPMLLLHWDTHDDMMTPFAGDMTSGLENLQYRNPWAVRNDGTAEAMAAAVLCRVAQASHRTVCSLLRRPLKDSKSTELCPALSAAAFIVEAFVRGLISEVIWIGQGLQAGAAESRLYTD